MICEQMIQKLKQDQYREAVVNAVTEIGQVLDQFYDGCNQNDQDELDNQPIILN